MRRLTYAWNMARHSPRLLLDYLRLWATARRAPHPGDGWSPPAEQIISLDKAIELAAPHARAGAEPGPAHRTAVQSTSDPGEEWASMDADASLGELAYLLIRALRPSVVIETGVAHGVSTAFVLAALEDNAHGELNSIDLPPPRMVESDLVGAAVPEPLKERWLYHWGSAKRLLPRTLKDTAGHDGPRLFIHDSDHSYTHMRWEIETAWDALEPGDVILADDANFHSAFEDAAIEKHAIGLYVRQPSTGGLTGMLIR